MISVVFTGLAVVLLVPIAIVFFFSPGRPKPFRDAKGKRIAGSICEKFLVKINGARQGMFLRGIDKSNPVILFVHGGPGMPEFFLAEKYMAQLEQRFTVCYWEQRGSGLSRLSGEEYESLTVEQMVADVITAANYLCLRFRQKKIYLMAHSWGTFLGIQAAARAPELFYAYIGMAQVARQGESERMAYRYLAKQYEARKDQTMLKKMRDYEAYRADPLLRDRAMHDLGVGTTHAMKSVFTGIFLPVMLSRSYRLPEKIGIWRGKAASGGKTDLRHRMEDADLMETVPELSLPVYFFSGAYDYTVSRELAESYFRRLIAPVKGFYLFRQSAHSPVFEEPEKALRILLEDVLAGKNDLSDIG